MTEPDDAVIQARSIDARESLASDPGAALESRPSPLRSGSVFVRVARVGRERRKAIVSTIVATTLTLMLMAGSALAWQFYTEWRRGRIEFVTDGAPLVGQVLAELADDPIGEPFDLVSRAIVSLPAGEHRLRVNGMGRLGRTYRFAVNRGETQSHSISIDEGRLLGGESPQAFGLQDRPPEVRIPFAPVTLAIELTPGKTDMVEQSRGSLIRRDGATGKVMWDALHPANPFAADRDPSRWLRNVAPNPTYATLADPAPDLDGDGTGDLVWTFGGLPSFLALSGKDGSMLWNYAAELDGPGGPQAAGPVPTVLDKPSSRGRYLFGVPVMSDVDRDGSPDVIATVAFGESREESERRSAQEKASAGSQRQQPRYRRFVLAVSGRSGRWLWSYPVDKTFRELPGPAWWKQSAAILAARSSLVGFVDGAQWIGLDPATGRPQVGPIELGFIPVRRVQYADVNGDSEPEILALGPGAGGQQVLTAIDVTTGRPLWTATGRRMNQENDFGPAPDWPIVVDLDQDDGPEIVVPEFGVMPLSSGYQGMRLIDGRTGATRWVRPMSPGTMANHGLDRIIAAPDLDGDGTRDLVTASTFEGKNPSTIAGAQPEEPERVYVDAVSGKDGHPLWWWNVDLPIEKFTRVWKPLWWGRGPDGWPLLAVPLGGRDPRGSEGIVPSDRLHPRIVHVLKASTGKEVHTVTGLTNAGIADLDGDGLADLWGEADGELRAFRGEEPEAWRALGRFGPPDARYALADPRAVSTVDFDGDHIGDAMLGGVRAPGASASETTGSRTALARSGRDGHVIWKTVLDPRENWFEPSRGESYGLTAFPAPEGDFNGDGTPDVIVQKYASPFPNLVNRRAATLPLQLLSGRTGGLLWSAGPLPLGFEAQGFSQIVWFEARAVVPGAAPDLLVRYGNPFRKAGPAPPPALVSGKPSLARISGRDGRILWDVVLANDPGHQFNVYAPSPSLDDMDGDGVLDSVIMLPPAPGAGQPDYELLAISLRDGKRLWSRPVRHEQNLAVQMHVGDLDGDKRAEVIVMQEFPREKKTELHVSAFDGRDGNVRWTWDGGAEFENNRPWPMCELADLSGDGTKRICISFKEIGGMRRIVVLDQNGKEHTHRDLPGDDNSNLFTADLEGDRRDEILIAHGERLYAWGRDLKQLWSRPDKSTLIEKLVPASPGRAGLVIMYPALALNGITGQSLWAGQRPLVNWPRQFMPSLLDRGDGTRLPLLIGDGLDATVCRVALPTTPQGTFEAPRGALVQPGLVRDDPRWTRALPWLTWLKGPVGPWGFLAAGGLAFLNVILPLLIFRLVAGRRRFSVRALMALPVAAALPLMVFLMLEPVLPVGSSPWLASEKRLFISGTVAGLPIILSAVLLVRSLARGRWRPPAVLAGLMMVTSFFIAAVWLWFDMKSMPAIERYGRSGWYLVLLPGAYAASVILIAWGITERALKFVRRRHRSRIIPQR